MGFIYKITNKINNKCYIGETRKEDPYDRWRGHIQSIKRNSGCPILKGAIKKYGVDNFKFEVLIICFDKDRFIYEREYIQKYNSQTPNGYNILPGGEGGGFLGKNHSEESKKKIGENLKNFHKLNPNHFETYREKLKESMSKVDISSAVKNSEKWKKALAEKRMGGGAWIKTKTEEEREIIKENIRQGVLKYYSTLEDKGKNKVNIEKHREAMAKSVGKKVSQFDEKGKLLNTYCSISEGARQTNILKGAIQSALSKNLKKSPGEDNHMSGGFIWRFAD